MGWGRGGGGSILRLFDVRGDGSIKSLMSESTALRDELAKDRTILANERTVLAYGRTTLALVGLAVIIFKFSDTITGIIFGSLCLAFALSVGVWGVRSYRRVAAHVAGKNLPEAEAALAFAEID